ncbi:MAG TPA: SIMPL domain-containing protein [Jatrophihabitans sp.]|jgi:hypothetical protein|uniref:SIMPL domain-containing protein n=1 Tax=Jatrophihabitans sp. TaxID=1932789 RepID=UPI002DF857C8|nr:SIMPL domain-containing protein [Jatrophihabitans sp.]
MTAPTTTTISVRGDAQRTVAPDQAQIYTTVVRIGGSRTEATAAARQAAAELLRALADLGGVALTLETLRAPLAWSVPSMNTHEDWDKSGPGPTGRHVCELTLQVLARDFDVLAAVTERLTGSEFTRVNSVHWSVDDDNATWALVRADAIEAALRKGDDYAAALGGSVISVEHVADAGLLGGDQTGGFRPERAAAFSLTSGSRSPDDLTLDPVPQVLRAVIDARFTATIGALPGR